MRALPLPVADAGPGKASVPAPLNRWQHGLWFIHRANPDCGAYHLVFSLAVQGPSLVWGDDGRITVLLQSLLDGHPVLGLRVRASADGPLQERDAGARPRIRWVDLRGFDDAAVRERARQDAREPMNLGEAPLWRLNLYRTHADRWVAAAVVHHLLLDFWSLGLLLSQVAGWSGLAEVSPAPDGLGKGQDHPHQQCRGNHQELARGRQNASQPQRQPGADAPSRPREGRCPQKVGTRCKGEAISEDGGDRHQQQPAD